MSFHRGVLWAVTIEAAIAVAVIAACTTHAHAATAQTESNRIATWMADELHADIPARTLVATQHHQLDEVCGPATRWAAYVCEANPDVIRIRPWIVGALQRRSCIALRYMLHEHGHSRRDFDDTPLAEGVVDAIAHDLYPKAARDLRCRERAGFPDVVIYTDEAEGVWTTSVVATGSRNRNARAAREWVRRLWAADTATRHKMIAEAQVMTGEGT